MKFINAIKNSETYSLIKNDIDNGNLAQAYMVVSPDVEAVFNLLLLTACTIYCKNNACLKCNDCLRILHYNHPDIKIINSENENIKVDTIRDLIDDSMIKSCEGKKIYIINSADKMNIAAQNKFLKTLEEPPKNVIILMGVGKESAMLDTIKSRVRKIYLNRFSKEIIYREIYEMTHEEKKAEIASICSDGLLGYAYNIAMNEKYDGMVDETISLLAEMKKSSDIASYLNNDIMAQDKFPLFLDTLSIIMRDMLIIKTSPNLIMTKNKENEIKQLSNEFSTKAIGRIIYLINEERKKSNFHVSNAAVVENLLFGILEEKFKCRLK